MSFVPHGPLVIILFFDFGFESSKSYLYGQLRLKIIRKQENIDE